MSFNLPPDGKFDKVSAVENYHVARVLMDMAGRDDLLAGILIFLEEIGIKRDQNICMRA